MVDAVVEGRATLRPLDERDLDSTLAWRNDDDSRTWFHSTARIEPDQHRAWFAGNRDRADDQTFVLELHGVPVAQVALYGIAGTGAELGRMLVDPARRGEGIAATALSLVQRLAVEQLGLTDLHLEVKDANSRAIAAYERAGFTVDRGVTGSGGAIVMRWSTT